MKHLLDLWASIVTELRRRDLARTNNEPLGDIAEVALWLARGGVLELKFTKSHDITTTSGHHLIEQPVRRVPRVFGRQPNLTQARTLGTDITSEMKAAYARIDGRHPGQTVSA